MNLLQLLEKSGLDSVVAISVPISKDVMMMGVNVFPMYFISWAFWTQITDAKVTEVEDQIPPDLMDTPGDSQIPRAMFAIENCSFEDVQQFARTWEKLHAIAPNDPRELIVMEILREPAKDDLHQDTTVTAQTAAAASVPQFPTNAQEWT